MRTIERTGQFKRDYKRESKGRYRSTLDADLIAVIGQLAEDQPLEARLRDHALSGDWADHRDCHIRPDLVLIIRDQTIKRSGSSASARIQSLVSNPAAG